MVIHINKLYTHTAVVTHIYIYIWIYSSEPCTNVYAPKNIYILVPSIQTNTNSSTVPVHIYFEVCNFTADHEQIWQPYTVDPYFTLL